jgi:hypothetical protein
LYVCKNERNNICGYNRYVRSDEIFENGSPLEQKLSSVRTKIVVR